MFGNEALIAESDPVFDRMTGAHASRPGDPLWRGDADQWRHRVHPGRRRHTHSLPGREILALVDHDSGKVLGRTRSGTLRLAEDERGVSFEIDLPETTAARDVLALVERGDAGGMSFGFTTPKGRDEWHGTHRTIRTIHLHEISVITSHPAYQATTVEARAAAHSMELLQLRLEVYR